MRIPRTLVLSAVAALFVGCGGGDAAATADAISASAVDPGLAGGNKLVKVLTRNLYIGADVTPFITGGTADPLVLWSEIQATDFGKRSGALAAEIVAGRPDLVGLQEAYRFEIVTFGEAGPTSQVVDYVDVLLAQLAARGASYRKVVESRLLDLPVPLAANVLVKVTDRDVILVRDDLETENAASHVFSFLAPLPPVFPGVTSVPRGWTEVDVKVRGERFRFVNAHLEIADIPQLVPLQVAQAMELVANLPSDGPVILVGDFNADANAASPSYAVLRSVLDEAVPPGAPPTCCQAPLLDNPASVLDERVDLVLFRGPVTAERASLVGGAPAFADGAPLWASDHAGVLATLRLWDPDFYALR